MKACLHRSAATAESRWTRHALARNSEQNAPASHAVETLLTIVAADDDKFTAACGDKRTSVKHDHRLNWSSDAY